MGPTHPVASPCDFPISTTARTTTRGGVRSASLMFAPPSTGWQVQRRVAAPGQAALAGWPPAPPTRAPRSWATASADSPVPWASRFPGGSSSSITDTRCRRPRGSLFTGTSPAAMRRFSVDRENLNSRQASALVSSLISAPLIVSLRVICESFLMCHTCRRLFRWCRRSRYIRLETTDFCNKMQSNGFWGQTGLGQAKTPFIPIGLSLSYRKPREPLHRKSCISAICRSVRLSPVSGSGNNHVSARMPCRGMVSRLELAKGE